MWLKDKEKGRWRTCRRVRRFDRGITEVALELRWLQKNCSELIKRGSAVGWSTGLRRGRLWGRGLKGSSLTVTTYNDAFTVLHELLVAVRY